MNNERLIKTAVRWSLMATAATAVFWAVWHFIVGNVPVANYVEFGGTIQLPFGISRWWDVLAAPVWGLIAVFFIVSKDWFPERRCFLVQICAMATYLSSLVSFIICFVAGLIGSLVLGLVFGLFLAVTISTVMNSFAVIIVTLVYICELLFSRSTWSFVGYWLTGKPSE